MSKLAHSNEQTMAEIEFRAALEDGNEDLAEGYYWVRAQDGEIRIAEWQQQMEAVGGRWKWLWSMTRGEEADPFAVTVIERIEPPKDTP